jgi:hypothetical protein
MAITDIKGMEWVSSVDFSGIFTGLGQIATFLILFALCGIVLYVFYFRKKSAQQYNITLHFFREVNGQPVPAYDWKATELTVPQTNIHVFYVKEKDMYLPRGTKPTGKDHYWYHIRPNGELINYVQGSIDSEIKASKLDYDHTDMRYAYANLMEIIKRNYRDKSVKWWVQYQQLISVIIYVLVFTLAFYFLITKIGGIVDSVKQVADSLKNTIDLENKILENLNQIKSTSGVVVK